MIYLTIFATTTLLLFASARSKGVLEVLLVSAGLLLPCLLAGFRDETIGVDVLSYAKWMEISAQDMGLLEFMQFEAGVANPGWNLFTWVSVNVTGGLPGYLFCIEALCILPVYFGLRRMCKGWEWAGVLVWLLLWYAFSLNGMRQSVAMGIVFFSTAFVLERKSLHFLVGILIAFLFHQTAVVGVFIYVFAFAYRYSGGISKLLGRWRSAIVFTLVLCVVAICIAFGEQIVLALSVLKDSYSYQVNRLGESDFSYGGLYLTVTTAFLWASSRRDFANSFSENEDAALATVISFDIVCGASLVGSLFWQLNLVSDSLGRIGYYGTILFPLMVGMLGQNGKRTRGKYILAIGLSVIYFVTLTLILGHSGVVPYASSILGIE